MKHSFSTLILAAAFLATAQPAAALWPFKDEKKAETKSDTQPVTRREEMVTSFKDVVTKVSPSVVNIFTTKVVKTSRPAHPLLDEEMLRRHFGLPGEPATPSRPARRMNSLGSGVIISEDGYILTNNHVIEQADEIKVMMPDNRTEYDAKLVGTDPRTDLAVLKIEGKNLPAITFGDSEAMEVGDIVLAIGNPFGLGQTVTMGIISAKGRGGMGITELENFIQTDAAINRGNSGGALVDAKGRLVGINNAILSQTGGNIGIGFAVPASMARNIFDRIVRDGKVIRGYLGVMIQQVTPREMKAFNLPDTSGALVGDVTPKSGAEEAGIRRGDVITHLDGRKIEESRQLQLQVSQLDPGTKVKVSVLRDGKSRDFLVTLKPLPDQASPEGPDADTPEARREFSSLLSGVEITELDGEARRQISAPSSLKGAIVTSVARDSLAFESGLRPGDVILEINKKPVRTVRDAFAALKGSAGTTILVVWNRGVTRFIIIEDMPPAP